MKKQLLALAGAAALGVGVIAGNTGPSVDVEPTAHLGYLAAELATSDAVSDNFFGVDYSDYGGGMSAAIGGRLGETYGDRAARAIGREIAKPVRVAAHTAARAAFTRGGMLMGARIGGMIGAFGGPFGFVLGTGIGMA